MNASFETINEQNMDVCRELCNELMAFQKSKAIRYQEWFDDMTFENRILDSYKKAHDRHAVLLKVDDEPAGYAFTTIETITENSKRETPPWMKLDSSKPYKGFYPNWLSLPKKVACLNNLYLRRKHRHDGLGNMLLWHALEWIDGFSDVDTIFVFISNGNTDALRFYLSRGFLRSHEAFDGFITTAYRQK